MKSVLPTIIIFRNLRLDRVPALDIRWSLGVRFEIRLRHIVYFNAFAGDCDCPAGDFDAVLLNGAFSGNARANLSRIAGQGDLRGAREDWILGCK